MLDIKFPIKPLLDDYNLSEEIVGNMPCAKKEYEVKKEKREKILLYISFVFAESIFFFIGILIYFKTDHDIGKFIIPHIPDSITYGIIACLVCSILEFPLVYCSLGIEYILSKLFCLRISNELQNNEYNYAKYSEELKKYNFEISNLLYHHPLLDKYGYDIEKYQKAILNAAYRHICLYIGYFMKRGNSNWWRKLDPFAFEEEVAKWFREQGYKATVTKKSGDGGYDIILLKNDKKIYVQCKHYNSQVGVQLVREFYGVLVSDNIEEGIMVILDKGYTKAALDFINDKNIRTMTLHDLTRNYSPEIKKCELNDMFIVNNVILFKDVFEDVTSAKRKISNINTSNIESLKSKLLDISKKKNFALQNLFEDDKKAKQRYTFGIIDYFSLENNIYVSLPVVVYGEYNLLIAIKCTSILDVNNKWEKLYYQHNGTVLHPDDIARKKKELAQERAKSHNRRHRKYWY